MIFTHFNPFFSSIFNTVTFIAEYVESLYIIVSVMFIASHFVIDIEITERERERGIYYEDDKY